ncbi:MAG: hypothetical protein J6D03_00580 [Clostridia bacterium]|nr:hypothetical protein [Clostridia bacterium]
MEDKYQIYFGDNGLTSTSANHICNKAKEYIKKIETELNNIRLYSTSLTSLTDTNMKVKTNECLSINKFTDIANNLETIGECKSLCAWLREAIKAKDATIKTVHSLSFQRWLSDNNIDFEMHSPYMESSKTFDDFLATLSIKELNRYYSLEAKCAAIGKYIHTDGAFYKARMEMYNKQNNPVDVQNENGTVLVYQHEFPLASSSVDDMFFNLNQKYRSYQAELNSIKHKGETWISNQATSTNIEYGKKNAEYQDQYAKLFAQYQNFLIEEEKRVSNLKIIIPDALKNIYELIDKV